MWTALKILGYHPYHFKEISRAENIRDRHLMCWREAFYAKLYGSGPRYQAADFAKILHRYDAVTDAPAVNFSEELVATFPDAKVILSRRDSQKWLESIFRSYNAILQSPTFRIAAALDGPLHLLGELFELVLRDWTGGDWRSRQKLLEGFATHNAHVQAIVPAENLLVWEPKDGWQPLCDFLGRPVPDVPFPYSNKGDDVAKGLFLAARIRIAKWAFRKAAWPLMAIVVGGGTWLLLRDVRVTGTLPAWMSFARVR